MTGATIRNLTGLIAMLGLTQPVFAQRSPPGTLLVGAKYAHQRDLAEDLGADVVVDPDQVVRAVRRVESTTLDQRIEFLLAVH